MKKIEAEVEARIEAYLDGLIEDLPLEIGRAHVFEVLQKYVVDNGLDRDQMSDITISS